MEPRIQLRPLALSDVDALAELYADPDVNRFIGGPDWPTERVREQVVRFMTEWSSYGYGQSAIVYRGAIIGRAGLHRWPQWAEVELGYVLARRWQGRGLAREAAQIWLAWARRHRPAPYLTAVIDRRNAASIDFARGLGFSWLRDDVTDSGVDVRVYALDLDLA